MSEAEAAAPVPAQKTREFKRAPGLGILIGLRLMDLGRLWEI